MVYRINEALAQADALMVDVRPEHLRPCVVVIRTLRHGYIVDQGRIVNVVTVNILLSLAN